MSRERVKATVTGVIATLILAAAIFLGSRNLPNVDAALVGYTFACLFAMFGLAYRYSMWLQRPPTRMYWRRGWQAFFHPGRLRQTAADFFGRLVNVLLLNRFILRRSSSRGVAHLLVMWG